MAINFLTTTNTLPEIQINDAGNNPRLELQESGSVSGGISTTGGALVFEASSGIEKARILSTGQFLIGHTSYYYAGTYLQVGNTSDNQNGLQITTSTTGNGYILFGDGTGADAYTGQIRYSHTDNFMRFNTNSDVAMTIDSSQRVGIGTLTPSATLHVKPASGGNGEVNIERTSGALINLQAQSALGVIGTNSNHNLAFKTNSTVGMTLSTGGKVGIGTSSPAMMLHVKGGDEATMKLESTSGEPAIFWAPGGSSLKWENRASASRWQLYQYDQSEWVFNIYDAKVGIGTVSPSYKLDVDGDVARIGSSNQQSARLIIQATNTAGAPASTATLLYSGYEQRATGAFHVDSGLSGEEWFSGVPYAASFNNWQVGYDASGGQAEYTANAIITAYHNKSVYLNAYGSGSYTGTAATYLAVTSSGQIIETGSGGVLPGGPYLPLAGGTMTGTSGVIFPDSFKLKLGASSDFNVYHSGSHSYLENYTGDIIIQNNANDKDIIFQSDDGSGGTTEYFRLDGSGEYLLVSADLGMYFNDGIAARFGNSGDLYLYHSGTESVIANEVGNLYISQRANDSNIIFESDDSTGGVTAYFQVDGANHRVKFSKNSVHTDNVKALFGDSLDLEIYHDGSDSYIKQVSTGNLYIQQDIDNADMLFQADNGSGAMSTYFYLDGSLTNGTSILGATRFPDNSKIYMGTGGDLEIFHDGSHSYLRDGGTGNLWIQGSTQVNIGGANGEIGVQYVENAGVGLRHNNVQKLLTSSTGVSVTGNMVASGDVYAEDNIYLTDTGTARAAISLDSSDRDNLNIKAISLGSIMRFYTVDTLALTIDASQNATFAGTITTGSDLTIGGTGGIFIPENLYHVADTNTYIGFPTTDEWRVVTGGAQRLDVTNSGVRIGGGARVTTILDEDTMSSDSATALATQQSIKAYVDSSITGSTTYRGTWDPNVSLNSGYGNPNLNTVTKQDGYYYICSGDGVATPNGTGTEPDSWHTGDWVVYNSDLGSSGEWQKIDNTSVISGTGTGQKVVKWDGSGTSETLANGPITFSTNDSTFAGDTQAPKFIAAQGTTYANGYQLTRTGHDTYRICLGNSEGLRIVNETDSSREELAFDGAGNATFAGDVSLTDGKYLYIGASNDLQLYHDGTDSYISNTQNSGDLIIQNGGNDKDVIFKCDDGSGGVEEYFRLDGSAGSSDPVTLFPDSSYLKFGSSQDFSFVHNGSTSYIQNFTGDLQIQNNSNGDDILFRCDDGSGGLTTYFYLNGGDTNTNFQLDTLHPDNVKAKFGTSADLQIYHDGSNSFIKDTGTGQLKVSGSQVLFYNAAVNAFMVRMVEGAEVELYYNSSKKLETTSAGVTIGALTSGETAQLTVNNEGGVPSVARFKSRTNKAHIEISDNDTTGYVSSENNFFSLGRNAGVNANNINIDANNRVGIGTTTIQGNTKVNISGAMLQDGKTSWLDSSGTQLTTTGRVVAGLVGYSGGNGASALYMFTCYGGNGYQRIVYSIKNSGGTWIVEKDIDEGQNAFDVVASTPTSGSAVTFTFKARSTAQSFTASVWIEHIGSSIDTQYVG